MEESHTEKENTTGLSANNVLIKAQGNNVVVQVSASASQLVLGKKQSFSPGHYADKLTSIAAFFFFICRMTCYSRSTGKGIWTSKEDMHYPCHTSTAVTLQQSNNHNPA